MAKPVRAKADRSPSGGDLIARLQAICGKPGFMKGEDAAAYEDLRTSLCEAIAPRDFQEALCVQAMVDATWENWRRARFSGSIVENANRTAVSDFLSRLFSSQERDRLLKLYDSDNPKDRKQVEALLARKGFGAHHITAEAFRFRIKDIEVLDRLSSNADARRITFAREIDRRRDSIAPQGTQGGKASLAPAAPASLAAPEEDETCLA